MPFHIHHHSRLLLLLLLSTTFLPLLLANSCPPPLQEACQQAEVCFNFLCDTDTGEFQVEQCQQAQDVCGGCYPNSPCSSSESQEQEDTSNNNNCDVSLSPQAYELANGLATSNGGMDSALYNLSVCSFQQLLSMDADESPMHLIVFFSTKIDTTTGNRIKDSNIALALSEAAQSVGGALVLRNRILLEMVLEGANFVQFAGVPNPAALQQLLLSEQWKSFVTTLQEDATIVSLSVTRLPMDVRPAKPALAKFPNSSGVDCAYQPVEGFNNSSPLPWPERPGSEGTNALFLQADQGGLIEVLNFNKELSEEAAANATFDYVSGVAKAGLRHGFLSEPKLGCLSLHNNNNLNCQSYQLAGSALLGYDSMVAVQYPSVRAFLAMTNDENWIFEQKADEHEWSRGIPSAPIFSDEVQVVVPQAFAGEVDYIGDNFASRTGFSQPPTPCNDDAKRGLLNEDIATADCLNEPAAFQINAEMANACLSLWEEDSEECSEECRTQIAKIETCVDPLPNLCNLNDAFILSAIHAALVPASNLVPNLSARCWYLETQRRGCSLTNNDTSTDETEDNDDDDDDDDDDKETNDDEEEISGKKGKKSKKDTRKGGIRALSLS